MAMFWNSTRIIAFGLAMSFSGGAFALETFTLENLQIDGKDAKTIIPRADFVDTNLSRDEASKLFTASQDRDAVAALLEKLEARRIAIPEIRIDAKAGKATVRGIEATDLKGGRFAKIQIAGVDGSFSTEGVSGGVLKVGALLLEDGEYAKALGALRTGDATKFMWRIGKIDFAGFEISVPDKDMKADAPGGNLYTIRLASVTSRNTYQGDLPLKGVFDLKNLTITPPAASKMGQDLQAFGYPKLDVSLNASGMYDPAKKTFALDEFTLSGVDAGSLAFKGLFASVEPESMRGGGPSQMPALMRSEIANLTIRFANAGLVEKAIAFFGKMQNRTPEQVKREFASMVTSMAPMMLGPDPAVQKIANAVADFVRDPKSLMVSLAAKGAPVKLEDLTKLRDPSEFLAKVNVDAAANR